MQNTTVTTSFTDADTIQLRFELGTITDAVATDQIPDFDSLDDGWIWQDGWIGRVQLSGDVFMPLDTYTASVIDPLFDAPGGETVDRIATIDKRGLWSVTVNGEEVGLEGLSRKSNILDSATVGWGVYDFRTLQNVFLDLEAPLQAGDQIEVRFDDAGFAPITATYDPAQVVSEAIHVNLTGYDPDDSRKVAYLSSWNGWDAARQEGVAQGYDGPRTFRVIDAESGAVAFAGQTTLGTPADQTTDFERNYSLTDVWEMDLSEVTQAGRYYIEVDGVGRSPDFDVADDVWADVFETSFSGFYHQRSGIALEAEYTDWTRDRALHPEDGNVVVYATTLPITETDESYNQDKPDQFGPLVAATTDEVLEGAWGGWHDAGDWDRRTQHLEASRKLIDLVEIAPEWAESVQAQIPENANGLPDLLDEALWNLEFFARMQTADGGVRGGIEGDDYRGYGANSAEEEHTLYAYAPDTWTTWEFAASAAKMSRVIEAYDADAAALWLDRAERAMEWAEARVPSDLDVTQATSRNLAAAELYSTTGDAQWHDLFKATSSYSDPNAELDWNEYQYEATIAYNRLDPVMVDAGIAGRAFSALEGQAAFLLDQGSTGGFGFLADPYAPYGWGITASQPFNAAKFMVALHDLTGEDRYLEAIQGDVQYGLGANPMNMAFLTGLDGLRGPEIILNADADSVGGTPPPGITLYGDYNIYDYGQHPAYDTMWNALYPNAYEAPVHESFNGYYLFVPSTEYTVQQGIADMTYATGYLASQAGALVDEPPVEEPPVVEPPVQEPEAEVNKLKGSAADDEIVGTDGKDVIRGLAGDDIIQGSAGADVLKGGSGEDQLFGGAGADKLVGGDGNDLLEGGDGDDVITGGADGDALFGGVGADRLVGGEGADMLVGGAGGDRLKGGDGDDVLSGQSGDDTLYGGQGRDVFVFGSGSGTDTVKDFARGEDRIDLTDLSLERGFETIAAALSGFGGKVAVLTFEDQDTVVRLRGVDAVTLTAEDFLF